MCSAHIPRHIHYEKLKNMCSAHIFKQGKGFNFIRNYAILAYYFVKAGQERPLAWQKFQYTGILQLRVIQNNLVKWYLTWIFRLEILKILKLLPVQTRCKTCSYKILNI